MKSLQERVMHSGTGTPNAHEEFEKSIEADCETKKAVLVYL